MKIILKNIIGWVSGVNLSVAGQTPIVVNGFTGEVYNDKAVSCTSSCPPIN